MPKKSKQKPQRLYAVQMCFNAVISELDSQDEDVDKLLALEPGESTKVWDCNGENKVVVTRVQ